MNILTTQPPPADFRIPYGPDPLQFGDLRLPSNVPTFQRSNVPTPVVVVIHGGFWRARYDLEHIGHLCAALTAQGYATWSLEYRRIGNPGGGWPGTFQDVAMGAAFLRQLAPRYNLDLDRVITLGHSAGGHLALWLASESVETFKRSNVQTFKRFTGVVSLAGVCDLRRAWELRLSKNVVEDFLGGSPDEVPERYAAASPIELLPLGVPQVLVHGTEDEDVPYEISTLYCEAALVAGDKVELVTLQGAGHFEAIDPDSEEWPAVVEAVHSLL